MGTQKRFWLVPLASAAGLASILASCSSEETSTPVGGTDGGGVADAEAPPGTAPVPDDFYGGAGEAPAGAKMISSAEFDARVADGTLIPTNGHTQKVQEAAAARQEADDDRALAALFAARPELRAFVADDPPANDPTVEPIGDGNYRHTIQLANGKTAKIVTMGRRWEKHAAAEAVRTVPTYRGQLGIYRRLYALLDATQRRTLGLVDPSVVEVSPGTYGPTAIQALNAKVADAASSIIGSFAADPKPPGYVSDCTKEIGVGDASDRAGEADPTCKPDRDPNGIFEKYAFPAKWYLTCVKDQANRGTCSGFADTSAVEYWVARTHAQWVNLSEQAFYNRARLVWAQGGYADGLNALDGFTGMEGDDWLLPFENQWKYNPSPARIDDKAHQRYTHSCDGYFDTCSDATHQSDMFCADDGSYMKCAYSVPEKNPNHYGYRMTHAISIWDPNAPDAYFPYLRIFLAAGYPVVIGHPITPSFDAAGTNHGYQPYNQTDHTSRGGHGIHAVGIIDNATLAALIPSAPPGLGGGYVIVKNSWSRCWGDGGYIYVAWQSIKDHTPDATLLFGVQ